MMTFFITVIHGAVIKPQHKLALANIQVVLPTALQIMQKHKKTLKMQQMDAKNGAYFG